MLEIRPTTAADCEAFYGRALPYRIKAYTGLLNGEIIAIGGIGYPSGKPLVAFADLTAAARAHPLSLHRFARMVLAEAKAAGAWRIVAKLDAAQPAAERWLTRLGFTPMDINDKAVWTWQA
jgi:hypothetical protein